MSSSDKYFISRIETLYAVRGRYACEPQIFALIKKNAQ